MSLRKGTFATRRRESAAPLRLRASRIIFSLLGPRYRDRRARAGQNAKRRRRYPGNCAFLGKSHAIAPQPRLGRHVHRDQALLSRANRLPCSGGSPAPGDVVLMVNLGPPFPVAVRASRQDTGSTPVGAGLPGMVLTVKRRPCWKTSSGGASPFVLASAGPRPASGCPKALANCPKLGLWLPRSLGSKQPTTSQVGPTEAVSTCPWDVI